MQQRECTSILVSRALSSKTCPIYTDRLHFIYYPRAGWNIRALANRPMVWYGMVRNGMVWYGMVWYGIVWYGMVLYGMVWYGMVWYGMVWYGMVWYGMV